MSRKNKSSQRRIEANRLNALKSTGPRTEQGKANSAQNATKHGLASTQTNPLAKGCFLQNENEAEFRILLAEYSATYHPQHRDEYDLLTEAVYAKWRQQRIWLAQTAQIEVAIALNEPKLQKDLPTADPAAHLANGIAQSENLMRLYLRYDAQLHRQYLRCLKELRDLQAERVPEPDPPNEPKPPVSETESPAPEPVERAVAETAPPNEPKLTPEQARLQYMQAEIRRFEEYQAAVLRNTSPNKSNS
jgi:hypothetical protein